jgi:hypothetical protein
MGWVIKTMPRPLYPQERQPVPTVLKSLWAGLDGYGKSRPPPTGIRSPGRPARSASQHRVPVLIYSTLYFHFGHHQPHANSVQRTRPKNSPHKQWFSKILSANSLIWSETGSRKTLAHKKDLQSCTAGHLSHPPPRYSRSREASNILHGLVTHPISWWEWGGGGWWQERGDNLMTAVGWFFAELAFAYRFIAYLQLKNSRSIIQLTDCYVTTERYRAKHRYTFAFPLRRVRDSTPRMEGAALLNPAVQRRVHKTLS